MHRGEQSQELVLRRIRVLEFIDEDVPEPPRVGHQDILALPEQLDHAHDQVAEVDRVRGLQRRLILRIHFGGRLAGHVVLRHAHLRRQDACVLPAVDPREVRLGRRGVESEIRRRSPGGRELVGIVVDGKRPR